jgi:hypothetical protein
MWCISVVTSFGFLALYRSGERHGPDMVGEEVSAFSVPLLTSFLIAALLFFDPQCRSSKWQFLARLKYAVASLIVGIVEVAIYSIWIVR